MKQVLFSFNSAIEVSHLDGSLLDYSQLLKSFYLINIYFLMNMYFSDHDAVKLKIEIKQICGINGDIDFRLFQFIKHVFILQVSKSTPSSSVFFKIKYTWYIILNHERSKTIFT